MTAASPAVCDQQAAAGAGRCSRGVQRAGRATDRRPCPPGSQWTAMRSSRWPAGTLPASHSTSQPARRAPDAAAGDIPRSPILCSLAIHEASGPTRPRSTGYARPGWLLEGGRLTGEQLLVPGRRRSRPGSSAVAVGATPLGSPGQPSRSPPASSAMTWFLTRSCSTCASQSWPGAHRHQQPADQLLPP